MDKNKNLNSDPINCEYSFFSHTKCEFFPCHKTDCPQDFNCLFCYCPLYALGDKCGGTFTYLKNGIKDCSNCLIPHKRNSYSYIASKFAQIAQIAACHDDKQTESITPSKTYSAKIQTSQLVNLYYDADKFLPLCKGCSNYEKNYACPPNKFNSKQLLMKYQSACFFCYEFSECNEESTLRQARIYCDNAILHNERFRPGSKAFLSGACVFCAKCQRESTNDCVFPQLLRPSIDALSLDITRLCKDVFHYELTWNDKHVMLVNLLLLP